MAANIFSRASEREAGLPQPLCWAEEVYLIYPAPSTDPRSFPSSTAAAVGDRGAWRHTAVPRRSPCTPAEDCWIWPCKSNPGTSSPSLSSNPSPCELFGTICKFSFFLASTSIRLENKRYSCSSQTLPGLQLSTSKATVWW